MQHQAIVDALQSDRFVLSDLGDGTAVLTSLTDSRIVSLNTLGQQVVSVLLEEGPGSPAERCDRLAAQLAERHGLPRERLDADINLFVNGLSRELARPGA